MKMIDQIKWLEINAAMREHKAGKITFAEAMQIVSDVKNGDY